MAVRDVREALEALFFVKADDALGILGRSS
jgi:hypothetical protein